MTELVNEIITGRGQKMFESADSRLDGLSVSIRRTLILLGASFN